MIGIGPLAPPEATMVAPATKAFFFSPALVVAVGVLGRLAIPPRDRRMVVVAHGDLDRAVGAHDDLAHLRARAVEVRQELLVLIEE